MYSITFIYFSKVLWEDIVAIASELGHGDVCKYFQGARLEKGQATQCPAQRPSGDAQQPCDPAAGSQGPAGTKELALEAKFSVVLTGME